MFKKFSDYARDSQKELDIHITKEHSFSCSVCKEVFSNNIKLKEHIESHKDMPQDGLDEVSDSFPRSSTPSLVKCDRCGKLFESQNAFETHICNPHPATPDVYCDQCDFKSTNVKDFVAHLLKEHKHFLGTYRCSLCDFESIERKPLDDHVEEFHGMLVIMNGLAKNQAYVGESFDKFRDEVSIALKKIIEDNNIMKQELFILRQAKNDVRPEKQGAIHPSSLPSSRAKEPLATSSKPSIPEPKRPKQVSKPAQPRNIHPRPQATQESQKKNKVLLIGDSISGNVDIKVLETAMNADIKAVKAYAAIFDNVGNVAKKPARFPAKNFTDVTPAELQKEPFDILLLQSGSVDITNLETRNKPEQNVEYFKQEVVYAAKNLFAVAEDALDNITDLKKVIILNQTPRYDEPSVDPLNLKPAFVQLFNNTLSRLWMDSPWKSKLSIGLHSLECSGGIKEARYRDSKNGKFDGVHLFGPSGRKAYTVSILNILKSANMLELTNDQSALEFYKSQLQFQFQKRKSQRYPTARRQPNSTNDRDVRQNRNSTYKQRYTVPTSNLFEHLNY